MVVRAIENVMSGTFNTAMKTGWKGPRGFHDGFSGNTHMNGVGTSWRDKNGENVIRSPMGKLAQRLRADAKQIATGKKYNHATMEAKESTQGFLGRHVGNRIGGVAHAVGDLTIGAAATGLGWGTRVGVGTGAFVGKHALKGAGHVAYQGARDVTRAVTDTASLVHGMTKTRHGQNMLLAAGGIGALGVGGAVAFSNSRDPHRKSYYENNQVESLPGTLAAQEAAEGSNRMVDTGADGDLVFSLHNMR